MLAKLVELERQTHQPVHYTLVAQQLGIHNSAAYEMLKLLEAEGFITTEYLLTGNTGPGRSTVVFASTDRGKAMISVLPTPEKDSTWEMVQRQILTRLGHGKAEGQELLEELLSHLPNVEEPIVYCAQTLTALLLTMSTEARGHLQEQGILLQQFVSGPPARNLLGLLPGLALGLALPGQARRISKKLVAYSELCQAYLVQLDEAKQKALAEFVAQVLETLPELAPNPQVTGFSQQMPRQES
jgi:DNA-binding PadR family transcriptional regulator